MSIPTCIQVNAMIVHLVLSHVIVFYSGGVVVTIISRKLPFGPSWKSDGHKFKKGTTRDLEKKFYSGIMRIQWFVRSSGNRKDYRWTMKGQTKNQIKSEYLNDLKKVLLDGTNLWFLALIIKLVSLNFWSKTYDFI